MRYSKRPVIGMTSSMVTHNNILSVNLHEKFILSVKLAGGIPLVIPNGTDEMAEEWVSICDGIILTNGEDVDPYSYKKEPEPMLQQTNGKRDKLEIELVKQAQKKNKPVFGICRGITMLNVALGGTLIQDIATYNANAINHDQKAARQEATHSIQIDEYCWLYKVLNQSKIRVNSMHHQAIDKLAPNLKKVAVAPDGVIEAIESVDSSPLMLAVQWHPEEMASDDSSMQHLFDAFVRECKNNNNRGE